MTLNSVSNDRHNFCSFYYCNLGDYLHYVMRYWRTQLCQNQPDVVDVLIGYFAAQEPGAPRTPNLKNRKKIDSYMLNSTVLYPFF